MDIHWHIFSDLTPTTLTVASTTPVSASPDQVMPDCVETQTSPGDPFFEIDEYIKRTF